jgi:glycopeptide antibiotics resistance protein
VILLAKPNKAPFLRFLFLLYCGWMVYLLFFGTRQPDYQNYWAQIEGNYSIKPFYTIRNYMRVLQHSSNGDLVRHCAINLIGNIALFIPGGFFLPKIFHRLRPFWRFLLLSFSLLLLIECTQLFSLRGRLDVDDLILNLIGMLLGYLFYKIKK